MQTFIAQLENEDFYGVLKHIARRYGNLPALTDCGIDSAYIQEYSYNQLLQDTTALAAYIQQSYSAGTHIALCAGNSVDWILSFFGIICSGCIAVLLDVNMKENELMDALHLTDSAFLVTDRAISNRCEISTHFLSDFVKSRATERYTFSHDKNEEVPAVFLATSGVTSYPKYVMLSQKNILFSTLNGMDAVPISSGKTTLSILPLHHSYELSCGLLYHLCCGTHIYINDKKSSFIKNLRTIRPNFLVAVPSVIYSLITLMKAELNAVGSSCVKEIEIIYCGGASIDASAVEELHVHGVTVLQGYGMTECSPAIAFNTMKDFTSNTVGKRLRYVQLKILDDEIYVKAPNVMLGYYKNQAATDEVLQNGWLRTGDIGKYDDEGHIILLGRKKNVIVLKTGENIYPEELEERIFHQNGQILYCRVYENEGCITADIFAPDLSEDSVKEIISTVNQMSSEFKRIVAFRLLSDMPPTTALGKALRRE